MDFGNENARVRIEGDRISNLPDEIIHHILSFNDTKYAVQTSVLSSRWKLVWTTLPYLKFSTDQFRILPTFSKFVNRVLSRRNNQTEVSTVDLYFRGPANQKFVQKIANYALSHNAQKVDIFACKHKAKEDHQFPLCLFSSQSLKHLSLKTHPLVYHIFPLPQLPWDSPALTTIELNDVWLCAQNTMCLDLFSKCVSLTNLTLTGCRANGLKVMEILCPRLVHLTISRCWPTKYEIVAPNLSSFCYEGCNPLFLSTGGLNSLDKVNLRLGINSANLNDDKQMIAREFMNLLYELRNAKFVTLYGLFIEFLSMVLDLLEHQPSPFCNLKCLNIKEVEKRRKPIKSDMTNQVINYLLNSSPTATVNIEFRKETFITEKRSRRGTSHKESLTCDPHHVIQAIFNTPQFEERVDAALSKALLQFGLEDTPSIRRCLLPPRSREGSSNSNPNLNVQVFFEVPKFLEMIDQAAVEIVSRKVQTDGLVALTSSGIVAPNTPVTQIPPSPSPR